MRPRLLISLLFVLAVALATFLVDEPDAWAEDEGSPSWEEGPNAGCLICHTDPAETPGKLVDPDRFHASVHAQKEMACTECHFDFDTAPHGEDATTVGCADCHEVTTTHGHPDVEGSPFGEPPACADCHGVHDVLPAENRASPLHPLNVPRTCGKCHFPDAVKDGSDAALLAAKYMDDTHGRGLIGAGLVVAPSCVSCHGHHEVRPSSDAASPVHRKNVADMCGTCHVGILERYRESAHHRTFEADGEGAGATCTECHLPHGIGVRNGTFQRDTIRTCAACHEQRFGTFRQTYHGKVSDLGLGMPTATCASCHGSHMILPKDDPRSTIHPDNVVATCAQCHEGAHASFASYDVHADPGDAENYPGLNFVHTSMVWLLTLTFVAAGLHSVLWFTRSVIAKEWRRPPMKGQRAIRRWRRFYTTLHVVIMISFLFLACTGLPIHYSERGWASGLMKFFGGPAAAAFTHRVAATLMVIGVGAYLLHLGWRALVKREKGLWTGPHTMLPRWKDVQDLIGNLKWFFGVGPKPRFDRWTYWEKFDFWAVFWGMVVIGGSGIVLWFPVASTKILPAWAINVAVIVHGHEALLAVGFIFTIHIFNTHLRPDKFPMDTVFFTGRITEHEFRHERPLEYERAVAEGRFDTLIDEPRRVTRRRAYILGSFALAIGLFLIVMMIMGLVSGR